MIRKFRKKLAWIFVFNFEKRIFKMTQKRTFKDVNSPTILHNDKTA